MYVAVANSVDFSERLSVIAIHGSLMIFVSNVGRPKENLATTMIATFFLDNFDITKFILAINQTI